MNTNDAYKSGQLYGKTILECQTPQATPVKQDTVCKELCETLNTTSPSSEEHTRAFKDYQSFHQGVQSVLETYTPPESGPNAPHKTFTIKSHRAIIDAIINAPDYISAMRDIGAATTKLDRASKTHPEPIDFMLDTSDLFYKEGLSIGASECAQFTQEAQGKKASLKERIAHTIRVTNLFSKSSSIPQGKKTRNSLHFQYGIRKAYKEYPLEDILAQYNIPQEIADKIRFAHKIALQHFENSITGIPHSLEKKETV